VENSLGSFPPGAVAIVLGATGGLGGAFLRRLKREKGFVLTLGFSRSSEPAFDLEIEETIRAAALQARRSGEIRLVIDATGVLHGEGLQPEKSWAHLDPRQMAKAFAINAIGPALIMKHFLPLFPVSGKALFATLSAKVGSIGDNRLGGWHSYRASKAALNQLVRTAAVELKRRHPEAVCAALHPGTVNTRLSAPFAKAGLAVKDPDQSADALLRVIDRLTADQSGGFFDCAGAELPW
jgi:NAD(P)-dependent dehydrogenase (short-subunit alcohol dehydrogenase family)